MEDIVKKMEPYEKKTHTKKSKKKKETQTNQNPRNL